MKKLAIAAALSLGILAGGAMLHAADTQTIKGVLIDQKCGKGKDEAAAAKHPKSCTKSCSEKQGLQITAGDKVYKLDDASKKKAEEYLEKDDSKTKVEVTGTVNGETLTIESIKAQ